MVMEVMRAAIDREAAGERVIHMEVGQPGAPAPQPVLAAARAALEHGRIAYTEAMGLRALRTRIARSYADAHGIDVSPDRIAVTTGSSAAFNLAFLAAFDVADLRYAVVDAVLHAVTEVVLFAVVSVAVVVPVVVVPVFRMIAFVVCAVLAAAAARGDRQT